MSGPLENSWVIKVQVNNHMDEWLLDCFEGLQITNKEDGTSIIIGQLNDIPAVYGFIIQLRDLSIPLLTLNVEKVPPFPPAKNSHS